MYPTIRRATSTPPLSNDDLRESSPSIFALKPWNKMSERYKFIPTIEVVDMMRDQGFQPMKAQQSTSRIDGKGAFTKHLIRFRHGSMVGSELALNQEIPEIVLMNSHDGSSSYELMAGVFRLVCTNGLIVQSSDLGSIKLHHKGGSDFQNRVVDATYQILEDAPLTMEKIETWKQIELTEPQQLVLAQAAQEIKPNESILPERLLASRRREDGMPYDQSRDLWRTFNAIQENMVRGGIRGVSETGRRSRTRAIKSVAEDVRVNKALWTLTERMAQLVS